PCARGRGHADDRVQGPRPRLAHAGRAALRRKRLLDADGREQARPRVARRVDGARRQRAYGPDDDPALTAPSRDSRCAAQHRGGAAEDPGVKGLFGIRWTVGRKLGLAFGAVALMLLGLAAVAWQTIDSLNRSHQQLAAYALPWFTNRAHAQALNQSFSST